MKEPEQRQRIFFEKILRRNGESLTIDNKTPEGPARAPPANPRQPAFVLLVGFENGAKDPSQITDVLCDQKVVLHEALDPAAAGVIRIIHPPSDLGLQVEGQPLLGTAGEVMDV